MIILIDPSKHRDPRELPSEKRNRELGLDKQGILRMCKCARCEGFFMWHEPWALCPSCKEIIDAELDAAEAADAPVGNLPQHLDRIVATDKLVAQPILRDRRLGDDPMA